MRNIELIKEIIDKMNINLSGLTVLTECASAAYAFTPILCALAGAKVYSLGKDTSYGSFASNKKFIEDCLKTLNLEKNVHFFKDELNGNLYSDIDIYLNLGMLRPITEEKITTLKKTAVIPLMWEAFEFRPYEIDLEQAIKHDIPVIGCAEKNSIFNIFEYNGYMILKMLFEMGLEIHQNKVLLCGDDVLGKSIFNFLDKLTLSKLDFLQAEQYSDLKKKISEHQYDVMIIADMKYKKDIISESGLISAEQIVEKQNNMQIAHVSGSVDYESIRINKIKLFPEKIANQGHMSYQITELGFKPVFELLSIGIKVGEIAARHRLAGGSARDAIQMAIESGFGQMINYKGLSYER